MLGICEEAIPKGIILIRGNIRMLKHMRGSCSKGISSYSRKYANVEIYARKPFLRDYLLY
jgi:hypothetical protein